MLECDQLLLSAMVLAAVSGVPGLFYDRRSPIAPRIATVLMIASGALGLVGAVLCFGHSEVTVLVYNKHKIERRFTFTKDKPLTEAAVDEIAAAADKMLPPPKKAK